MVAHAQSYAGMVIQPHTYKIQKQISQPTTYGFGMKPVYYVFWDFHCCQAFCCLHRNAKKEKKIKHKTPNSDTAAVLD